MSDGGAAIARAFMASQREESGSWRAFLARGEIRESRLKRRTEEEEEEEVVDIMHGRECETVVPIGARLPDRFEGRVEEDVFGRRRGLVRGGVGGNAVLACDVGGGEEESVQNIAKAIDCSKGRLRKSANMSNAFKAVIKSGEGLVRRSELIQATLNSEQSKDPSIIILLDPDACDASNMGGGVSDKSEESSCERGRGKAIDSTCSLGFSTSMTARQCAATLETILRELSCKVVTHCDDISSRALIKLRATRLANGGRKLDRKIRLMITIREEDDIRTSVAFRRVSGLYTSRDSHVPLCAEIRERFQKEWPAVVEALYIRLPNGCSKGVGEHGL